MLVLNKSIKEKFLYLFFGVLTTLVNLISYFIIVKLLLIHYLIGNALAWIFSVLFAYITNRRYVFAAGKKSKSYLAKEVMAFFGLRGVSGLVDMLFMFLLVSIIGINDSVSKISVNVLVVILNYVFSKYIIFKRN